MKIQIDSADCLDWLSEKPQESYAIGFADPPFAIKQSYDSFVDDASFTEQQSFSNRWISRLWTRIAPGGVMALYHPVKMQRIIWSTLNAYGFSTFHENTLVFRYDFGQNRKTDFIDAHCQCVILRKPGKRKWRPEPILVESERLKMGDKRCLKSEWKGMRVPGNVLESPRVQGNNRERWDRAHGALVDHPNQIPLKTLRTIVLAYSDPGDSVIEPFAGSGGLALVCSRTGRNYDGCDISENTAASARLRVENGFYHESES